MIEVMSGRAESIRLEPPGAEGEGVEFWLSKDNTREYHQVKRQHSASGRWTLAELDNKQILSNFLAKLTQSNSVCVFVSMHSAFQLEELSDRARRAASWDEFKSEFLKGKSQLARFNELRRRWGNCSGERAYDALRRVYVETASEKHLRANVERHLGALVTGNPANVADVLAQLALDRVHQELAAHDIWSHLESRGYSRQTPVIGKLTSHDFPLPLPRFFVGRQDLLDELATAVVNNNTIVVGGMAGIGKTYLVAKFVDSLGKDRSVVWVDCSIYGQLEQVLVRLAEFVRDRFADDTLTQALQSPSLDSARRIEITVSALDDHHCVLVWDDFSREENRLLIPLLISCNQALRSSELLITTREWIQVEGLLNPVYQLKVPSLSQDASIRLMRHYLDLLGLGDQPEDILIQAHRRVGGHPHFLRLLIVQSENYPLPELLDALPHFAIEAQSYLQQEVFNQLDEEARLLLKQLSVLRIPFPISAVEYMASSPDPYRPFGILLRKFLVSRQGKDGPYYDIHDLVRDYAISQASASDLTTIHKRAVSFYKSLDERSYLDVQEMIHHSLEAGLLDEAAGSAHHLVSHALHNELFDYVVEFTSFLSQDPRTADWDTMHYARGRALRFKERFLEALAAYRQALAATEDTEVAEAAKLEIASMLVKADEEAGPGTETAEKYYKELTDSKNSRIKVGALNGLGFLYYARRDRGEAIRLMKQALGIAEEAGLLRHVAESCQGLGKAYGHGDKEKAIRYLERARSIRESTREETGSQDVEAEYYLFDALADLYAATERYSDAVRASELCVEIDRRLKLERRLARSLYQLGRDECLLGRYERARSHLQESASLIEEHHIQEGAKRSVLEWLAVAYWNSHEFELAVEYVLEYNCTCQRDGVPPVAHAVVQENDLTVEDSPHFIEIGRQTAHLLVLPNPHDLNDVVQWNENVLERRPELATVRSLLLHKPGGPV